MTKLNLTYYWHASIFIWIVTIILSMTFCVYRAMLHPVLEHAVLSYYGSNYLLQWSHMQLLFFYKVAVKENLILLISTF